MKVIASTGALFGTDESSGVSVANNATGGGAEVDVLGASASYGWVDVYLMLLSGTPSAGSVDVKISPRRVSGQSYKARVAQWSVAYSELTSAPRLYLGRIEARRFLQADVANVGTGSNLTLSLTYALTKVS